MHFVPVRSLINRKVRIVLPAILVAFFLFGCTFDPDELTHQQVDKNIQPPDLKVDYLDMKSDTVYLYSEKYINPNLTTNLNQPIISAKILVDGATIFTYNATGGYSPNAYLDYQRYSEGNHTITLEALVQKGTGSMADQLGMETTTIRKNWVLKVDKSYSSQAKWKIDNGYLKLGWAKYSASDFAMYRITKIFMYKKLVVENVETTDFVDDAYVGEGGWYQIEVVTKDSSKIVWGNIKIEQNLPTLQYKSLTNTQYSIWWTKSPFSKAIQTSTLIMADYPTNRLVKESTNENDTLVNVTIDSFADVMVYTFKIEPKNKRYYNGYAFDYEFRKDFQLRTGIPIPPYKMLRHRGDDDRIYVTHNNELVVNSTQEKRTLTEYSNEPYLNGGISLSPRASCYALLKDSQNGIYEVGSTSSLNSYTVVNMKSAITNYIGGFRPTDVGTAIVFVADGFKVYDYINSKVVAEYKTESQYLDVLSISSDGKYIMIWDGKYYIFNVSNGQRVELEVQTSCYMWEFNTADPTKLVGHGYNSEILIYNVENMSKVTEYRNILESFVDVDFHKNQILTYSSEYYLGTLHVRNLLTGELIKDIPFNAGIATWTITSFRLIDGIIYCPTGFSYNINQK